MSTVLRVALLGHSSAHEDFTYAFGLYRLAAYCRSLGLPHPIRVFDRPGSSSEDEDFGLLAEHAPDVVGLSAFIWNLPRIVRLVSRLRALSPAPLIVVGGPSAKGYDEVAVDATRPDLLVLGFGEQTFANILKAHAEGVLERQPESLGQVIRYRDGRPEVFGHPPAADPLDRFPSPYLDGSIDVSGHKTLYVETDRGCPYSCAFCIESTAPPRVSRFSLARIEQELAWALAHGIERIELCSAIFNLDTEWLEAFVERVERVDPGRQLAFSAALFTTYVNDRQVELFGRLRMKSALFGLNSVNPATFKAMRRSIHPERFREKIALFATRVRPQVSLIMGLPGDTPEGLRGSLEFALTLPADVMLFRFMVLPNTLYYERREELGLEIDFAHANRIQSTSSCSRDDLRRMEEIAAGAGLQEVNPGEWVRREGRGRFAPGPEMRRGKWNFLYGALQAMDLGSRSWPHGWRHERVFLDVPRSAGLCLRGATGELLNVYIYERAEGSPAFHRSRFFNLAYEQVRHRPPEPGDDAADLGPLLDAVATAFDQTERDALAARGGRPPG